MKHLTAAQRGTIETLLQEQYTNKAIARKLGRSPSGIGREIAKGLDGSGQYSAFVGQVAYNTNRKRSKQIPKLDHPANHQLRSAVVSCIERGWDPSQVAGRLHDDPAERPRYRTGYLFTIAQRSWMRKVGLVTGRVTA